MAVERPRWRDVREFLDDLPVRHCQVKPPHEFCTICMRINYGIAYDCPLYGRPYIAPSKAPTTGARAAEEPVRASVTSEVAREALRGEEFPVIEFAGPRRQRPAAAPKGGARDEAPLEVEALEVVAIEEAPAPKAEAAPASAAPAPDSQGAVAAAAEAAPAAPPEGAPEGPAAPAPAATKVDPEELMHRIMEELEIPEEEELPEDEEGPGGKAEGGSPPAPAEREGPPSEGLAGGPEAPAPKSRVAEKRIVLRRKRKGG